MKIFIQIIKASSKYFKAGQGTMSLTENINMEDHNRGIGTFCGSTKSSPSHFSFIVPL